MSHYAPYPAYKDSGVEWLGRVPEGWSVKRLRYGAELNPSVPRALLREPDAEVSFIPMECVGEDGSIELDRTRAVADVKDGYSFFENGDVVFAKVTPCFENGKHAVMRNLVGGVGFGTTELTVLRATTQTDVGFVSYIVQSERFRQLGAGAMTGAGGLKRVPDEFTRNFVSGWPNPIEQNAIAEHLDRETVRLDGLVAKKTRFIELLREKRQALITHAVTKGLDPNVKMKDSNVEWLGQVPEHWDVTPLKWTAQCSSGDGIPVEDVQAEQDSSASIPVIGGNGVMGYSSRINVRSRLLAVGRVGALCGNVHIVEAPAWITDNALVVRVNHKMFATEYLGHALRTRDLNSIAAKTAQPLITGTLVGSQILPRPRLEEQNRIVFFIERATTRLDTLIEKTERSIALIKERRAALITAAVTGQIDLRAAA